MWIFLITGLMIGIGNIIAFQILKNAYDQELYRKSVQLMTLFAEDIQAELERVTYDSENMVSDEQLQNYLSEIQYKEDDIIRWYNATVQIANRINSFRFYSEDIDYVYLIDVGEMKYGRFDVELNISQEYVEEMIEIAKQANGREEWVFFPELSDSLILVRDVRERKNFTFNSLGTLIIKVDFEAIVNRSNKVLQDVGTNLMVAVYRQGEEMYVGDPTLTELPAIPAGEDYQIYDTDQGKMFCCSYTFSKTGWNYVTALPYDNIFETVNRAIQTSLMVLAGVIVFILLFASRMVASIIKHIEKLTLQCDAFGRGEYILGGENDHKYHERGDEIGKLYRHFDRMASENDKMIKEIYVKQQLLLETQVSNLKAQIRPHFIYNTLESIYCLAETTGDDRIATMTSALGKLLRTSLKEQRNVITLKEDLVVAREYLKIQCVRLEERLNVTIEIEEKYEEVKIPSMTVQPIVENAIFYAAEEMLEPCEIRMYCRERNGFVEFVVEDNGPGMDTDIIRKLETKEIVPQGFGIGLENIQKRLKILISPDSGILVERNNGRTLVIIRLIAE